MLIFLKSGWLEKSSPALEFLILGYGKKSNFSGGTPNLITKSERCTVGTIMFLSGQGVEWYQVDNGFYAYFRSYLQKTPSLNLFQADFFLNTSIKFVMSERRKAFLFWQWRSQGKGGGGTLS